MIYDQSVKRLWEISRTDVVLTGIPFHYVS